MMKKNNKVDWKIVVAGLICLTALMGWALYLGYNGTLLTAVVGVICLAIGVTVPNPVKK